MKLYKIYRKGTKKEVARVSAHSNYSARLKHALYMKYNFDTNDTVLSFTAKRIK